MRYQSSLEIITSHVMHALRKRSPVLTVMIILSLLVPLAREGEARPLEEIIRSGYLQISILKDYPPFSFRDHEDVLGIDVEIAKKIASSLGVVPRFSLRAMTGQFPKVSDVYLHVTVDAQPSDIEPVAQEQGAVRFGHYTSVSMTILMTPPVQGTTDKQNTQLGVEQDSFVESYLTRQLQKGADPAKNNLAKNIRRFRDFAALMDGFRAGEVRGLIAESHQASLAARAAGRPVNIVKPQTIGLLPYRRRIGLAVAKQTPLLAEKLQEIMATLIGYGEIEAIFSQFGMKID